LPIRSRKTFTDRYDSLTQCGDVGRILKWHSQWQ
jgi:hypothetical protein